jgi:hypothetical protein
MKSIILRYLKIKVNLHLKGSSLSKIGYNINADKYTIKEILARTLKGLIAGAGCLYFKCGNEDDLGQERRLRLSDNILYKAIKDKVNHLIKVA